MHYIAQDNCVPQETYLKLRRRGGLRRNARMTAGISRSAPLLRPTVAHRDPP